MAVVTFNYPAKANSVEDIFCEAKIKLKSDGALALVYLKYFDPFLGEQAQSTFLCPETGESLKIKLQKADEKDANISADDDKESPEGYSDTELASLTLEHEAVEYVKFNMAKIMLDNKLVPVFDNTGTTDYRDFCEELVTQAIFRYRGQSLVIEENLDEEDKTYLSKILELSMKNKPFTVRDAVKLVTG